MINIQLSMLNKRKERNQSLEQLYNQFPRTVIPGLTRELPKFEIIYYAWCKRSIALQTAQDCCTKPRRF